MPKSCACDRVAALWRLPSVRTLPLAARALLSIIAESMIEHAAASGTPVGSALALRFGSAVAQAIDIAMLAGAPQSEVEAILPLLIARGLLTVEPDGALSCPLLTRAPDRSEINRINGLKGGAVRRRQAEERRQMSMALPIEGGPPPLPERPPESEWEAKPGSLARAASSASSSFSADSKQAARCGTVDEVTRIGLAAADAAGFDPARWTGNVGIVRQWLADGADEALILETVRRVMARGASPKSLGYFTAAIGDAIRDSAPAPAKSPWQRAYEDWEFHGCMGPMPQLADFRSVAA